MRKTVLVTLLMLFTMTASFAQNLTSPEQHRPKGKLWKLSAIALAIATSVDAHSSWGHMEVNPALRGPNGRFGVRSLAIKGLITGGVIGAQYMMMRNNPKAERYAAATNFALSGAFAGTAFYNYRLHAAKPVPAISSPR
jgi:hypothetical protein